MSELLVKWEALRKQDAEIDAVFGFLKKGDEQDATYKHLEFGTAGMRGLLGPGSNRMNKYVVRRATRGFAKYLLEYGDKSRKMAVAIAYDNRHFSREFALDTARYLASFNIESYIFSSLRATPELSFSVREQHCVGGIMITASHNPREYNGYKVYDETGCQLVPDKIAKVIAYIDEIEDELTLSYQLTSEQETYVHLVDQELDQKYTDRVKAISYQKVASPGKLKVVFTPQHGTAYPLLATLLEEKGYDLYLVEEQCSPDPDFSHTESPNPEEHKAYTKAIELAKKVDADLILSTDPDADRMGVVVKHHHDYVFVTGNQGGSILQEYIYSALKEHHEMPEHPVMFNTVVTSDLGEVIARDYGVDCEKTLTGFKYIGNKIDGYDQTKSKQFVFGYEESYGYLLKPFVRDKDAFQACSILAEAAAYYQQSQKTLIDVLNDLYAKYGTYLETQVSLTLTGESGVSKIQAILNGFRANQPTKLGDIKVVASEDFLSGVHQGEERWTLDFPRENVLKYFLEDGSWVAIRPSGTEPKCKFYFCIKAESEAACTAKFNRINAEIQQRIA